MNQAAEKYYKLGLQVIPLKQDKMPTVRGWQSSRERHNFKNAIGIGLVCGYDGLQGIDIDLKYDLTNTLFDRYIQLIDDNCPGLVERLLIQQTVSNGYHMIFKCSQVNGNEKYASRPTTDQEREKTYKKEYKDAILEEKSEEEAKEMADKASKNDKVRVLIETRGTGGFLAIFPTKGYSIVQGSFDNIPVITAEEREILIDCARTFNEVQTIAPQKNIEINIQYDGENPFEDYNKRADVVSFLESRGWTLKRVIGSKHFMLRPGDSKAFKSAEYCSDKRIFYVYSSSTDFTHDKGYNPSQVLAITDFGGDYTKTAKWLFDNGYGKSKPITQKQAVKTEHPQIAAPVNRLTDAFWTYSIKPRTKEITIQPVYYDLKQWLHKQGYWRYVYSTDKWKIVQVKDNIVTEVYKKDVKKHVFDYILEYDYSNLPITGNMVYEEFAGRESKIFSDGIIEIIDEITIDWNRDTEEAAFYYFKNKCVVITKDKYELIDYSMLPGKVWSTHIKQRDITLLDEYGDGDFAKFIHNVCGKNAEKTDSFGTTIGYMLHGYKDCTFLPAVILTDEIISDDPNGGSGKGIIIKAISHFKNVVEIDGKNFDFSRSFAFQRVNLDTQIIAFQDVQSKFDFEKLFSIITEGISVEKKNKDEFSIPFSESPKVMVTTNYVIKGSGSSHERRKIELELTQHYHSGFSPKDEFGRRLFDSWDDMDWNKFYNFMFDCVRIYLRYGVIEAKSVNLDYKKVVAVTSKEFVEWADEYIIPNNEYNKKDMFDDFLEKYSDFHSVKQRTFSTWCERYAQYKKYNINQRRSNTDRFLYFASKVKQEELQFN